MSVITSGPAGTRLGPSATRGTDQEIEPAPEIASEQFTGGPLKIIGIRKRVQPKEAPKEKVVHEGAETPSTRLPTQKRVRKSQQLVGQAPTMGVRAVLHRYLLRHLYQLFGWSWLILQPSLREKITLAEQKQRHLSDEQRLIVLDANQKGGASKSTSAACTATSMAAVTGQVITVIDGNQAKGNSCSRLGIDETKTPTVRTALKILGEDFDHQVMIQHLGHHPRLTNVRCIASDDDLSRANNTELTVDEASSLFFSTWRTSHTLVIDLGNLLERGVAAAALGLAHVVKFDFLPWQENSAEDARDTMRTFRRINPEIVSRSLVVVNGYQGSRRRIDEIRRYYAEFFDGHPVEQVVVIPYDKFLAPLKTSRGTCQVQPVRVIDPINLHRRTYLAGLERDNLMIEMAQKAPLSPYRAECD